MLMTKRFRIPVCMYDTAGLEHWLEEQATRGYHMTHGTNLLHTMLFEKDEPTTARYRVLPTAAISRSEGISWEDKNSKAKLARAGWEYVDSYKNLDVFRTNTDSAAAEPPVSADLVEKGLVKMLRGRIYYWIYPVVLFLLSLFNLFLGAWDPVDYIFDYGFVFMAIPILLALYELSDNMLIVPILKQMLQSWRKCQTLEVDTEWSVKSFFLSYGGTIFGFFCMLLLVIQSVLFLNGASYHPISSYPDNAPFARAAAFENTVEEGEEYWSQPVKYYDEIYDVSPYSLEEYGGSYYTRRNLFVGSMTSLYELVEFIPGKYGVMEITYVDCHNEWLAEMFFKGMNKDGLQEEGAAGALPIDQLMTGLDDYYITMRKGTSVMKLQFFGGPEDKSEWIRIAAEGLK